GKFTKVVFVKTERVRAGRKIAPARSVVGPFHRLEFLFDVEFFARFKKQNLQAMRRQDMGSHTAGRSGTDYNGIVSLLEIGLGGGIAVGLEHKNWENFSVSMLSQIEGLRITSRAICAARVQPRRSYDRYLPREISNDHARCLWLGVTRIPA